MVCSLYTVHSSRGCVCTYKTNPQVFLKAQPVPSTGVRLWGEMETLLTTFLWRHDIYTTRNDSCSQGMYNEVGKMNNLSMKEVWEIRVRKKKIILAAVDQWIECWLVNQRVASLIPSQGTCLGCWPGPKFRAAFQLGSYKTQSHIDVSLPLFLSPFPSL